MSMLGNYKHQVGQSPRDRGSETQMRMDSSHPGVSTAPVNSPVMVNLPLVHKDTVALGDIEVIQTCISCGAGERGCSVRIRTTGKIHTLPHAMSFP